MSSRGYSYFSFKYELKILRLREKRHCCQKYSTLWPLNIFQNYPFQLISTFLCMKMLSLLSFWEKTVVCTSQTFLETSINSLSLNGIQYIHKFRQDATVYRCLFTAKFLYIFRVSIAPIIRSTSKCNCSFWYKT